MKKNITTLEEIEKEQEKLKMTMKLTKQAFAENLGTNRYELKEFLLNNVALPGGVVGLGLVAAKKAVSLANEKEETKKAEVEEASNWFSTALPFAISAAQAYFFKQWGKEEVKEDIRQNNNNSTHHTLKKVV